MLGFTFIIIVTVVVLVIIFMRYKWYTNFLNHYYIYFHTMLAMHIFIFTIIIVIFFTDSNRSIIVIYRTCSNKRTCLYIYYCY